MADTSIFIHGWNEDAKFWSASRDGEPSFVGVQDLGDAINAAAERGVAIVIEDDVYEQMVERGDVWLPRPSRTLRPSN